MWNDCGALQPVRSGHLLLGQWRATGGMRHRLGTRGTLLSSWHYNRIRHYLRRGQLLHWRIRARGRVHGCWRHILSCIDDCDEWSPMPIGFILYWGSGARGSVHWCWRHLLPCIMRNEWSPLHIGFILPRWIGIRGAVHDSNSWHILQIG